MSWTDCLVYRVNGVLVICPSVTLSDPQRALRSNFIRTTQKAGKRLCSYWKVDVAGTPLDLYLSGLLDLPNSPFWAVKRLPATGGKVLRLIHVLWSRIRSAFLIRPFNMRVRRTPDAADGFCCQSGPLCYSSRVWKVNSRVNNHAGVGK